MKGSIRIIAGLFLILGGVGSIETSTSFSFIGLFYSAIGLLLLASGANANSYARK